MPGVTAQTRPAAIALGVFFLAIVSGGIFRPLSGSVATLVWKSSWMALCLVGLFAAHRLSPLQSIGELGFRRPARVGVGFGLLASLPMLLTFAFTAHLNPHLGLGAVLMTSIVSPLSEEMLFRGYLFRQLYRRAGWKFFSAVAVTGALFGLAHLGFLFGKVSLLQAVGEIAVISVGGAFYAWLFIRWDDNLWVPVALHAFMNLWCVVFACDEAIGSWRNNIARALTVVVAIVFTHFRTRGTLAAAAPAAQSGPRS